MGTSGLVPKIKDGDWVSVRQAIAKLSTKLGPVSEPTYAGLTLTGLTASRLLASNADKTLVSSDLASWVAQTANQVLVADDGDGSITLSTPQNIHTAATPTFAGLTISTTGKISFRDADISLASKVDGVLDINADVVIDMFYDNADVGDATDGQMLNINRRAGEGDDYISLFVSKDRKGCIGFSGDDDLLQLTSNTLIVNGSIGAASLSVGTGSIFCGIIDRVPTGRLRFKIAGVEYAFLDTTKFNMTKLGIGANFTFRQFGAYLYAESTLTSGLFQWFGTQNCTFYVKAGEGYSAAFYFNSGPDTGNITMQMNTAADVSFLGSLANKTYFGINMGVNTDEFYITRSYIHAPVVRITVGSGAVALTGPLSSAKAITSGTATITASADDTDVSGINILFINPGAAVSIGAFVGGIEGQVLEVVIVDDDQNVTIEHNKGTGNQNIFIHAGANETLDSHYGGWILVCHSGNWYGTAHERHS